MDDNTFFNCIVAAFAGPLFSVLWWAADLLAHRKLQQQKIQRERRVGRDF